MAILRFFAAVLSGLIVLSACSPAGAPPAAPTTTSTTTVAPTTTTATTTTQTEAPLPEPTETYVVLAFANHLPSFGVTAAGVPDRPWVRLATAGDYYTMTRLLADSDVPVVLSFSPVLLEQIERVADGQLDLAALLTSKPASELTVEDKAYLDDVFFMASPAQVDRFPRYRELADRRAQGRQLFTSDYRDLQVLFNLAWTSPLLLNEAPLADLVARGSRFSEADKETVLTAHVDAAAAVLDSLADLWSAGRIDVATAPLANPILPLLVTNRMDEDASDQITMGSDRAAAVLGRAPRGLTPAAGLIDPANTSAIVAAQFDWVLVNDPASATPRVLTSEDGNILALPVQPEISDQIALSYFAMDPDIAASDFVERIRAAATVAGPGSVVTVVADGTEPWGRYEDSGIEFLRNVFRRLAAADGIVTVLPSELVGGQAFDVGDYPALPTSFLSGSAELAAWELLGDTRREYLRAAEAAIVSPGALASAYENLLSAEGNDWYMWYSEERSSGEDGYYDELFRDRLAEVWRLLGAEPPLETAIPLQPSVPLSPTRHGRDQLAEIVIDNTIDNASWGVAGVFDVAGSDLVRRIQYAYDATALFVRVDFASEVLGSSAPGFDLYLGGQGPGSPLSSGRQPLGFVATHVVSWRGTNPVQVTTSSDGVSVAGFNGNSLEFAVPLADLGADLRIGDAIEFRLADVTGGPESGLIPAAGRGAFVMPNLEGGIELARIRDRTNDDYGPGTYSYVVDSEVQEGTYDLAGLVVRQVPDRGAVDIDAKQDIQFEIEFRQPLANPWSAPAGFSLQTIDLYLQAFPGSGIGARRLLPDRVAALDAGASWNYAFSIDGWGARQFVANSAGDVAELDTAIEYSILPDGRTVIVTIPRSALPEGDETTWRFGVAILANQAIPSLGVHALRTLAAVAGRFQLGGATGASNDTMILDLLHPEAGAQEELLTYPFAVLGGDRAALAIDSLARVPVLGGLAP